MKKLILIVRDAAAFGKREGRSLLIILLSLSLSVCVSLTMLSFFQSRAAVFQRMRMDRASYRFSFEADNASAGARSPLETFEDFFLAPDSPPVSEGYYAVSFSPYPQDQLISWRAYFPEGLLAPLSEREEERSLLEGRWFTEKELEEGAPVAVVGRDSYPEADPGGILKILDREIRVIGVRNQNNALPYRLMRQLSGKEKGFVPDMFLCTFKEPLTGEQLNRLREEGVSVICLFDIRKSAYYFDLAAALLIIGGVFVLTVLNMLNMFRHLILEGRYRFMVLKLCGAGGGLVFWGFFFMPLLLSMLGSAVGIFLYHFGLERILLLYFPYPPLSGPMLLKAFFLVPLLCFLVLLRSVWRSAAARPADASFWR